MTDPVVSIITPSYNQAEFLEETIQSVLVQDYPRIEYIVIDGGSTDGSLDIIKRYTDHLAAWLSEPDAGQTEAINKGFNRATGDIFAWINSDDVYEPGAVCEVVEYFRSNPAVGLVYGRANYIDTTGEVTGHFPAAETDYKRLLQGYVHIPQQSAFFRGRLWQLVGPLDPTFHFAMDYDLWVRLAAVTAIAHVHHTWANFRIHSDAKTQYAIDQCWPEMLKVFYRFGGSKLSIFYAKYLLRRLMEPLVPLRLRARMLAYRWKKPLDNIR
jgi:glycosyltransferase involved in cell wall biosynthesis